MIWKEKIYRNSLHGAMLRDSKVSVMDLWPKWSSAHCEPAWDTSYRSSWICANRFVGGAQSNRHFTGTVSASESDKHLTSFVGARASLKSSSFYSWGNRCEKCLCGRSIIFTLCGAYKVWISYKICGNLVSKRISF